MKTVKLEHEISFEHFRKKNKCFFFNRNAKCQDISKSKLLHNLNFAIIKKSNFKISN